MERSPYYEYWVDIIQDCMYQILGDFDALNPTGGRCKHLCGEVSTDIWISVGSVIHDGYCDIPFETWAIVVALADEEDLESEESRSKAELVVRTPYFQNRRRWDYSTRQLAVE